jgi:hypothetical protein
MAVLAPETTTDLDAAPDGRRGGRQRSGVALLLLAAVLFLGHGSRTINAPFGDSHDGRNAAVWASGSQSLRDEGPIASRLRPP